MGERDKTVVRQFVTYLTVEKGLAKLTVDAYQADLRQFAEVLASRGADLLSCSTENVRSYLQEMKANAVEARSMARKTSTLRHFYRFLTMEGLSQSDPMLNIESPKQWKLLPKALSSEQIDRLLTAESTDERLKLRNRAMVEVLYASGLRVSELVNLKTEDVDLDAGHLLVRGKGDKERLVPLGRAAVEAIRVYLLHARSDLLKGKHVPWLFVDSSRTKLSRQRIWQMLNDASAGEFHVSPHMLRHSLGSHMVGNGADLRTVQTILGHADLATTQIYTHLGEERLRSVYRAKHPRARSHS